MEWTMRSIMNQASHGMSVGAVELHLGVLNTIVLDKQEAHRR